MEEIAASREDLDLSTEFEGFQETWGCSSVVEHSPSMSEALGLSPSTERKKSWVPSLNFCLSKLAALVLCRCFQNKMKRHFLVACSCALWHAYFRRPKEKKLLYIDSDGTKINTVSARTEGHRWLSTESQRENTER